jgi:multiple sugar transport system permease protein/raffinose/stachyose/melibiose transport system permease protein
MPRRNRIVNASDLRNEYLLAMIIFSDKALMALQRGRMAFGGTHLVRSALLVAGLITGGLPVLLAYLLVPGYIVSGLTTGALVD